MNMKNEAQTLGFNGQGNFIDIETNEEVLLITHLSSSLMK